VPDGPIVRQMMDTARLTDGDDPGIITTPKL
jgi:hypothetical protein